MRPSGMLMIEHRLIERFIGVIGNTLTDTWRLDPVFIDAAVDFFRTYADRTHHGKEEDILFKALENVEMSGEHTRIMNELIEEHKTARKNVGKIVELNDRYRKGDREALAGIIETLRFLSGFYPGHIEKEDKVFFPAAMRYLGREKVAAMLEEFRVFDMKMIHEKYRRVVETYGG